MVHIKNIIECWFLIIFFGALIGGLTLGLIAKLLTVVLSDFSYEDDWLNIVICFFMAFAVISIVISGTIGVSDEIAKEMILLKGG